MTMKPRVLILHAPGTNRDREAALACERAGGQAQIVHINELSAAPGRLDGFQMLVLPGGFSYGDDLGAGKLWALELRYRLGDALARFHAGRRPILGICNGFQALVKTGFLPGPLTGDTAGRLRTGSPCRPGADRHVDSQRGRPFRMSLGAPAAAARQRLRFHARVGRANHLPGGARRRALRTGCGGRSAAFARGRTDRADLRGCGWRAGRRRVSSQPQRIAGRHRRHLRPHRDHPRPHAASRRPPQPVATSGRGARRQGPARPGAVCQRDSLRCGVGSRVQSAERRVQRGELRV